MSMTQTAQATGLALSLYEETASRALIAATDI